MCQINTDPMVHRFVWFTDAELDNNEYEGRSGYVQVVVPPSIVQTGQSHDMVVR